MTGPSIASSAGRLLAGATDLLARLRATEKPLHPHGQLVRGRLVRHGADEPSGVEWLDGTGDDEVLVRTSRALGTPAPLPDIHGLAVRVPDSTGGFADLLLATTAWNRVGRHLLLPTLTVGPTLTTLLPYRTAAGPVVIGARNVDDGYRLCWAPVGGHWRDLGDLTLDLTGTPDAVVSFDPIRHHPPGMSHYAWVSRLRARSYATARARR